MVIENDILVVANVQCCQGWTKLMILFYSAYYIKLKVNLNQLLDQNHNNNLASLTKIIIYYSVPSM